MVAHGSHRVAHLDVGYELVNICETMHSFFNSKLFPLPPQIEFVIIH
jgi:hypothetical protein